MQYQEIFKAAKIESENYFIKKKKKVYPCKPHFHYGKGGIHFTDEFASKTAQKSTLCEAKTIKKEKRRFICNAKLILSRNSFQTK